MEDEDLARELIAKIHPILAGNPPEIVGVVLADLLATYLASHVIGGDTKQSAVLREELLVMHMETVRRLIPHNEREILQRLRKQ